MASLRACLCEHKGVGHSPTLHMLLLQASADCHCMFAVESRISSNMTISAFYRTQKLQFNVPRTYLCLIILNKIGRHLYLLPLANIGLFKWNHLAVTSFSLFNNRVICLDFLFNGSTCQRLKVSRHIISASTHCYMKFGVYVFSLMALISIRQSFHFKISHLIFILSISTVFVFGELFYHHYYYFHISTFQQWQNQILFLDIITNSSS